MEKSYEFLYKKYIIMTVMTLSTHKSTWNINDLCEILTSQSKHKCHNNSSWMQSVKIQI